MAFIVEDEGGYRVDLYDKDSQRTETETLFFGVHPRSACKLKITAGMDSWIIQTGQVVVSSWRKTLWIIAITK
jgi:hypothetical protein